MRPRHALRWTAGALLASALLSLSSCILKAPAKRSPISAYLGDPRDLASVRRIMVLPFALDTGVTAEPDRIRDVYVQQLQKLRRFDIVPLPTSSQEVAPLNASLRKGRIATAQIVALCDRYNLDGVLVGTVTAWCWLSIETTPSAPGGPKTTSNCFSISAQGLRLV